MGWVSLHIGHSDFLSERSRFEDSWSYFPEPWGRGWLGAAGESKEGPGGRESWSPGWSRAGAWLQWWRQAEGATYLPSLGACSLFHALVKDPLLWLLWQQNVSESHTRHLRAGQEMSKKRGELGKGVCGGPAGMWLQPIFALWSTERPYNQSVEKSSKYDFFMWICPIFKHWQLIIKSQFGPNELSVGAGFSCQKAPLWPVFWSQDRIHALVSQQVLPVAWDQDPQGTGKNWLPGGGCLKGPFILSDFFYVFVVKKNTQHRTDRF